MPTHSDYRKEIVRLIPGLLPQQLCGNGSYGAVYLAVEESTGRSLAVKYCPLKSGSGRERAGLGNFCKRMAGERNLLNVYHVVVNDDELCYTMELADNLHQEGDRGSGDGYCADTLARRIKRSARLPLDEIIDYSLQLISAVQALHKANLLHRDIKADNILFVHNVLKLGDIGLVCEATSEHSIAGTPSHLPPERRTDPCGTRISGDFQSDLYALGITIYCMLSGREGKFFSKLPASVMADRKMAPLNNFLLKACSDDPTKRYATIQEFREAFENEVVHHAAHRRRSMVLLLNALFATLLLLSIGGVLFYRHRLNALSHDSIEEELYPATEAQSALPWWALITPTLAESHVVFAEQFADSAHESKGIGWAMQREGDTICLTLDRLAIEHPNVEAYLQFTCGDAALECHVGNALFARHISTSGVRALPSPTDDAADAIGSSATGTRQWGLRLLVKDGVLRAFANSMPLSGTTKVSAGAAWRMEFRLTPRDAQQLRIEECCIFEAP